MFYRFGLARLEFLVLLNIHKNVKHKIKIQFHIEKINQLNARIEQKNSTLQQLIVKLDSLQMQLSAKINAGETDSI